MTFLRSLVRLLMKFAVALFIIVPSIGLVLWVLGQLTSSCFVFFGNGHLVGGC